MSLARFSVRNPVLVNLLMLLVIGGGSWAYQNMPRELFPVVSLESISIATEFPGAAPGDVEELVTIKLEDAVAGIEDLDEMSSVSQEGRSHLLLTLKKDARDLQAVLDEVRTEVERIDLPRDCEAPRIREVTERFPVITLSLYGDVDESVMRDLAEQMEEELELLDGVSDVVVSGFRDREFRVEVEPKQLEKYHLTLDGIAEAIRRHHVNVPGGKLRTRGSETLIRTIGEVETAQELGQVVVRAAPDGSLLRLNRVARVWDTYAEASTLGRVNQKPSLSLHVSKHREGDTITIAEQVRQFADEKRAGFDDALRDSVGLALHDDFSVYIRNRLEVMKQNATAGFILVMIVLCLLLNFRVALLTGIGIPISFLGAFLIMTSWGITVNMISIFSMIIVLGMVVDDAIIVGENICRHIEMGLSPPDAAIRGSAEVTLPVTASILTTIAAFLPMLIMTGRMGKFMEVIPLVVTFALAVSLFEAFIVLPSHMAELVSRKVVARKIRRERPFFRALRRRYVRFLSLCLRWRYVTVSMAAVVTALTIALVAYRIPIVLFESFEGKIFLVNFQTPADSSLETTLAAAERIEELMREAVPKDELESISSRIGLSWVDFHRMEFGTHLGQVGIELVAPEKRKRPMDDVIRETRPYLTSVEGVESLEIYRPDAGPAGPAMELRVEGKELAVLREISQELISYLGNVDGVEDLRDDNIPGKPELRIELTEKGRLLGLTSASVARQVHDAFRGAEATRIQLSKEDIPIYVAYPERYRRRPSAMERMKITTPQGQKVPFREVAKATVVRGPSKIVRSDRKRAITVLADIDKLRANALQVTNAAKERYKDIGTRWPGYSIKYLGERKEMEESVLSLLKAFAIAIALIYFILASLFRSFTQPFVVMFAIPFGLVGVVLGHLVMGRLISIMTMMGFVALTGIVVNDSLVLLDFVNRKRRAGAGVARSVLAACRVRLRPILLTSITTIFGLAPLAFFAAGQARWLAPMAIAIVWGLFTATLLTLIGIPCLYCILADVQRGVKRLLLRGEGSTQNLSPPGPEDVPNTSPGQPES